MMTRSLLICALILAATPARAMVDPNPSKITKYVYQNMKITASTSRPMVGQELATIFGEFLTSTRCGTVDWSRANGYRSDIRDLCNQGPGIYGFDTGLIVGDWDADDREAAAQRHQTEIGGHMKKIHARGGVVTFHWHAMNPIDGSNYAGGPRAMWQIVPPGACRKSGRLRSIPSCGAAFNTFRNRYTTFLKFIKNVRTPKGNAIPVVFRPFHENTGDWFWWGAGDADDFELWQICFRKVWSWMVWYAHYSKNVHSIIWAISPNGGGLDEEKYLAHSPPLSQVDVIGYDWYGDNARASSLYEIRMIVDLAEVNGKVAAVTELGYNEARNKWPDDIWTGHVHGPIADDEKASRVAWMLTWFNLPDSNSCTEGNYHGPHKRHPNGNDFKKFCRRSGILLEGDFPFYKKPTSPVPTKRPVAVQPNCPTKASKRCTANNGRGQGYVSGCLNGKKCGKLSDDSVCDCHIIGTPTAPNDIPYCLSNYGCGFGTNWDCGAGQMCAKTDETYLVICVKLC